MRETGIVYGNSLYSLAAEEGIDAEIKGQLAAVADALEQNGDFAAMLDAPQLPREEKLKAADDVFGDCHPYVVNTIKLLIEERRTGAVRYLAKAYEKAYNAAHNIAEVTVITAVPLDKKAEDAVAAKLKKQLGKEIILNKKIDPSILGGVVIRTDGLQIDGGVRHRLEEIKKEIVR